MSGNPTPEWENTDWLCDLGYISDVADHLNILNTQLQGKDKTILQIYNIICDFKKKTGMERRVRDKKYVHFSESKDQSWHNILILSIIKLYYR